ncbi:DUF1772-domain-containing protein [Amniculicola lignicola CBS 123094]|uniref:DUF1772-domain-containing protein n=1 Tax=Amniculicola lignicola CBS 123094 TaxID=1392246 RepID=A0A6A5W3K0_9PLEO|nr:DUF1772-domain-containing protein [Amniculicola lignicola CBS 123094]
MDCCQLPHTSDSIWTRMLIARCSKGQNTTLSISSVPAILLAPAPLAARQWLAVYNAGHIIGPWFSILSSLAFGYVAYNQDTSSLPFKLNIFAALAIPSIIPFTFAFIMPTNKKLFAKAESLANASLEDKAVEKGVPKEETVHQLVDKWGMLNLVRTAITGLGAVAAIWAAVDKREVVSGSLGLRTGAGRMG